MPQQPREGSTWRRWDLHIHSPATALNNLFAGATEDEKWEKYLTVVESAGAFGALGITDYFSIDGYLRAAEFKAVGRLGNVSLLLPNVEMRILPVTEKAKAINLHVILDPGIVARLDELLWTNLEFRYEGNSYKCTPNDLVRLGRKHRNDPALPEAAAYKTGVEQFKVDFGQIDTCLKKNRELRDNCLVAVANSNNDGNSGIQESGLAAVRTEIYRLADLILSGNPKDRKYFLGQSDSDDVEEIRKKFGSLKPCVHGCDAHQLGDVGKPDLNRHTWIKADTTFEGLRQIVFEPETRVFIGEQEPPVPIHRTKALTISIPEDAQIVWENDSHDFCLRGDSAVAFAGGLTCIIGGRGTGKSTLINFIEERLNPGRNRFWKERQLRSAGKGIILTECLELELSGDHTQIEFVAQNQVEQFALDPAKLTEAILNRLISMDHDKQLGVAKSRVEAAVLAGKDREILLQERQRLTLQLADIKRRIASFENLANSFTDQVYVSASAALQDATAAQQQLAASRERLRSAINALRVELGRFRIPDDPRNEYDHSLLAMIAGVEAALSAAEAGRNLTAAGDEEAALALTAAKHRGEVELFLETRGLSPENLRDVAEASARAGEAEGQRKSLEAELLEIEKQLAACAIATERRQEFDQLLSTRLEQVNGRFAAGPAESKRIELRRVFDTSAAEEGALGWLNTRIAERFGAGRLRADHLRSTLEKAGDILTLERDDLVRAIRQDNSKTAQSLDAFFGEEPNLALWQTVRERVLVDALQYLRIEVLYDGKPLSIASFGQRCSAVLVVLIALGNSPIVIDEPEAHLDSAIIAGFMVEMVKKVKQHRQVIFATHNANFVVNGDAELIHVLVPDDGKRTTIRSTTLEDLEMRPLILALEGGELAFRQREGRYRLGG